MAEVMARVGPLPWDPYWRNEVAPSIMQELRPLHEPGDVNTERVEHYIRALGIPLAPYVIVDEKAKKEVANVMEKNDILGLATPGHKGHYSPILDIAVIFNDGDPDDTELTTIHELGHRVPPYEDFKIESPMDIIRFWHKTYKMVVHGSFPEEGFVSMLSGSYGELLMGRPGRYAPDDVPYVYAGLAMEALCIREPDLFDHFLATRNDRAAKALVTETLHRLHPRLPRRLDKIPPHRPTFKNENIWKKGMEHVFRVTDHASSITEAHHDGTMPTRIGHLLIDYMEQTGYDFVDDSKD